MNTFPVFLNFVEITKYQNSIKNTDKQIEYCQYLISVCNEAEKNISDEDVEKFLDKYDLRLKIDNIINECTLDRDDIENSNILFCPNCQQFSNKIFNKLHNRLAAIKNNSLIELSWLNLYKITVLIDFEFAFLEDQVYRKFDEFDDKRKSLMWIKELERKLNRIYNRFPESLLAKLFQDFDLDNYFYVNESPKLVTVNSFLCLDTKYQNFKDHLNRHFLPFITKQKELLEMDIAIEDTKNYLSNGVTNEDVIFRQWDFDFNKVKFFSDNAFDSIEYKIQYLSYLIKCLKIKIPVNIQNSKFSTELSKIEEELKYLHTSYDLKKDRVNPRNEGNSTEIINGFKKVPDKEISLIESNTGGLKNDSNHISMNDKLIWLGSEKQLKTLLRNLQEHDCIENLLEKDAECKIYSSIFWVKSNTESSNEPVKRIKWLYLITDLAYLIGELTKSKENPLIEDKRKWVKTSNLFFNKNGGSTNPDNLNNSYNKMVNCKHKEILDRILKLVKAVSK